MKPDFRDSFLDVMEHKMNLKFGSDETNRLQNQVSLFYSLYNQLWLGVNFINFIRAHFLYKILAPKITKLKCY